MPKFERSKTLDLPSGRFFALESGPEAGPVVLCLHGFPGHDGDAAGGAGGRDRAEPAEMW